MLSMTSVN